MDSDETLGERSDELAEALRLMCQALEQLDVHRAPGEIGAHLDLAICRLCEHLSVSLPKAGRS